MDCVLLILSGVVTELVVRDCNGDGRGRDEDGVTDDLDASNSLALSFTLGPLDRSRLVLLGDSRYLSSFLYSITGDFDLLRDNCRVRSPPAGSKA